MSSLNETQIIDVLKTCFDPEIPVDLWSLGLIYNIDINELKDEQFEVNILMTLTTPGCSMGNHMAMDIKSKLEATPKIQLANVEVTFEPQWTPEMMNDDAKEKLGFPTQTQQDKKTKEDTSWE